jgi:hypothetical protein
VAELDVIARGLSRTRASSSGDSDEVRAFLQQRVGGFGLISTAIFGLFLVWRSGSILVETLLQGWDADWEAVPALAAAVSLFAGIWLFCRGKPRSLRVLRTIDVGGTLLAAVAVVLMPFQIPYPIRPDYIVIMALTYILLVRAIYIPSTWKLTAALAVGIAPMLLTSLFFVHLHGHDPAHYTASQLDVGGLHEPPATWAIRWTVIGAVWWLAAGLLSSVTSRVFYGLRKEVRDARKLGQYTLVERLGEGGMGVVYRASHALLRRPTAIKLLPPDKLGEESVARFEREVQLTALLTHPNTVRIFDYGRTPDQVFYYAMELLEGASLDRVVKATGALPASRVIHILDQIAGALTEAHGIGLIHRDIKPANIFLAEQGGIPDVAKVLDFGLVKDISRGASGEEATQAALSTTDSIAGTPQYMSPEAISNPSEVDGRADIYALGAVGYFLLAGVDVFKGRTMLEICSHHLHTDPLPPSKRVDRSASASVPADLESLILRCLQKSPAARPASARALRAALAACADAGGWSEEEARAWWLANGASLRGSSPALEASGTAETIAVDLSRREVETVRNRKAAAS